MFVEHKEQGEAAPVKVGTLKLSEAIRVGARIRPQCAIDYFLGGKSCALGAAWEGLGNPYDEYEPLIAHQVTVRFSLPDDLAGSVINMNDNGETRERIADWLESKGF
jgi:hypothetical protein